jgi:hypothetical protein
MHNLERGQTRERGGVSRFNKGHAKKNNFSEPEKLLVWQSRALSDGLVRGQRKKSCNISFLSLTRALPKEKGSPKIGFSQPQPRPPAAGSQPRERIRGHCQVES